MGKRGPKPKREEVIWSANLAYAIGLIASDGCLSSDGRHLLLVSKDIEQIRNIQKCLKLGAKIGVHTSGKRYDNRLYHRVQWGDVVLYQFLLGIGLTSKKSLTLGALHVPDEYFFDFLRGCFDGDGSFYSYFDPRWKSSFMFYINFASASVKFTDWLRETAFRLAGVTGHISRTLENANERKQMFSLRYAKRESLMLIRKMYELPDAVYLSRKRLKIAEALRIVGLSLSGEAIA